MPIVQFSPLPSLVSPSFWHKLTELKLDVLKLSDANVPISASYGVGRLIKDREGGASIAVNGSLSLEEESFSNDIKLAAGSTYAKGTLKNYNTIEEFKAADKTKLFNDCAENIWQSITTSKGTTNLNSFLVITYADLKKYKYYYWFAFPAFVHTPAWQISDAGWTPAIDNDFTHDQLTSIHDQLTKQQTKLSYFLVRTSPNSPSEVSIAPVESFAGNDASATTVAFIDPSAQPQNPGWPLRNLLAYLRVKYPETAKSVKVLCWRDAELPKDGWKSTVGTVAVDDATAPLTARPNAVGWEKNVQGKLGPRVADLAPMMDPTMLANQAVDLNLKLMRWRILPSLDLDKIAATKCLLLGAGTLGCYVSRCLMGWGVRNITLVDSARVSFSNPVRQPLFQFSDCLNGGKPKAECAAERLKEVWPGLNATGYSLSIPMPGHPIPGSPASLAEQVKKDVEKLEKLIEEHDVVYLLMDSRESRWLPTVIARSKGKLVMNAALGFDTYLVMRHGGRPKDDHKEGALGCYYCNDIVAPADSLTDRTLDQMCTVSRPGLASIAASTAVELMMSVIQHPDGIYAPAPKPTNDSHIADDEKGASVLGLVPHQLRGYLAQFRNMPIAGAAYDKCTGCSEIILKAYEEQGFSMLLDAFNDPKYLEKLTGLDKLFEEGEEALRDIEWMEGEEEGDF